MNLTMCEEFHSGKTTMLIQQYFCFNAAFCLEEFHLMCNSSFNVASCQEMFKFIAERCFMRYSVNYLRLRSHDAGTF